MSAATRSEVEEWVQEAQRRGATHLIVMVDTFDWEDYPVYIMGDQNINEELSKRSGKNMQRVVEVYNMQMNIKKQLAESRSYNL